VEIKKVYIIFTGGTIASKVDELTGKAEAIVEPGFPPSHNEAGGATPKSV